MTSGVVAFRCTGCGAIYFPPRLMCARCGGSTFAEARVTEAVIEEITIVRHVLGQKDWGPRRLANVRTPEGLRLTVGLRDESGPGDRIVLEQDGTAPFGRAAPGR
jgi:uncharacterized OB-fold protein